MVLGEKDWRRRRPSAVVERSEAVAVPGREDVSIAERSEGCSSERESGEEEVCVVWDWGFCCWWSEMAFCLWRAVSRTVTTLSTRRRRRRWRSFWWGERRQGVFLEGGGLEGCGFDGDCLWDGGYHSRPPDRGAVGLNAPNMIADLCEVQSIMFNAPLEMESESESMDVLRGQAKSFRAEMR